MTAKVVTRFAPSPTGYLHIGGARTALFNYLYSRKHGGLFRLRIEDTDKQRSSEEMTRRILDGLRWLGLDWDGEVVFQGVNAPHHREMARQLLEQGKAYRCFCTKEELDEKRRIAEKEKKSARYYDRTCLHLTPEQIEENLRQGKPYAIRFLVPEGETGWEDGVHGRITIQNSEIDDFIILRSDESPTYQLAVVVDDHDMGITQVIRGADHISNTPKQILLYRAFGWEVPNFAHVPLILGPDKSRLSKRHGATSLEEYRQAGYLPEAVFNYLALLGWSPGDDREILSREELIREFSLEGISPKNAIFDEKKLQWMNGQYISRKTAEELFSLVTPLWIKEGWISEGELAEKKEWLLKTIDLLKSRMRLLGDFVKYGRYYFCDPEEFEEKGLRKYLKLPNIWNLLLELNKRLEALTEFNQETVERTLRAFAEETGVAAAKLIHPLRLAVTGFTVSPGIFELLEHLGKETVVRRIRNFVNQKEILLKNVE